MKKYFLPALMLMLIISTGNLYSWSGSTHSQTVQSAVNFMKGSKATAYEKWAIAFLEYRSQLYNVDFTSYVAKKNTDTDNFLDTEMDGWWCFASCTFSLAGLDFANYTSYWHFATLSRSGNYNNYDGYSYKYSLPDDFWGLNGVTKSYLYNRHCNNKGNAGRNVSNPVSGSLGVKSAYRQKYVYNGSLYNSSTPSGNYEDYQTIIWEPLTNAAVYWYGRALRNNSTSPALSSNVNYADLGLLGHAMHMAGDANVPQHLWNTLSHNHSSYESWVDSIRGTIYDENQVNTFVRQFLTSYPDLKTVSLNTMILYFANISYQETHPLWISTDSMEPYLASTITEMAKKQYNRSVAVNVLLMQKFVNDLYAADNQRKF
jgi:hypothetical protein